MSTSALKPLIEGYQRFRAQYFENTKAFEPLVTNGQKPKVLIVACSDSRVDPAIITGSKPGELFMVRNVANLVPPFDNNPQYHGTSAALEFAVKGLGVTDIIVFGHSHCGGIKALMESTGDEPDSDFISAWMSIAKPAKDQVLGDHPEAAPQELAPHCEKASLLISLQNLATFPWIQDRVKDKQLSLHAWYFDLERGVVEQHHEHNGFVEL